MLTITDYVFGPVVSDDIAAYVKILIEEYHERFKQLYPTGTIIPKMHTPSRMDDKVCTCTVHYSVIKCMYV